MTTGVDVGKTRIDDLDRTLIRETLNEPYAKKTIVNLGCGESALSAALASLGHRVYNYDSRDLSVFYNIHMGLLGSLYFKQFALQDIKKHHLPMHIDYAVLQRVLHYLSYQEAKRVLSLVVHTLAEGGYLYLSFSGIESSMGAHYSAREQNIKSRWGFLDAEVEKDFNVYDGLCLYSQEEVVLLISELTDCEIIKIWTSQFGNHKCICQKVQSKK